MEETQETTVLTCTCHTRLQRGKNPLVRVEVKAGDELTIGAQGVCLEQQIFGGTCNDGCGSVRLANVFPFTDNVNARVERG